MSISIFSSFKNELNVTEENGPGDMVTVATMISFELQQRKQF